MSGLAVLTFDMLPVSFPALSSFSFRPSVLASCDTAENEDMDCADRSACINKQFSFFHKVRQKRIEQYNLRSTYKNYNYFRTCYCVLGGNSL